MRMMIANGWMIPRSTIEKKCVWTPWQDSSENDRFQKAFGDLVNKRIDDILYRRIAKTPITHMQAVKIWINCFPYRVSLGFFIVQFYFFIFYYDTISITLIYFGKHDCTFSKCWFLNFKKCASHLSLDEKKPKKQFKMLYHKINKCHNHSHLNKKRRFRNNSKKSTIGLGWLLGMKLHKKK